MPSGNSSVWPPTSTDDHFDTAAEMTSTEGGWDSNTTEGSHETPRYPVRQRRPPSHPKDYVSSEDIP